MKRNDKEWKTTIDAMERILRQLEALGDNLEHPVSRVSWKASCLSGYWIEYFRLRHRQKGDLYTNLENYLLDIVGRSNKVVRPQAATATKTIEYRKPSKFVYKGETSAVKSTEPADL
ncbi:unnamed protein product, partial [Acanthocheilonema viteae]